MCRQAGITRATTIEEAFEAAATFATQPLPAGPAHRGDDDRGRLGSRDRRRDRRAKTACNSRRCPTICSPPSTSISRRAGAATTRSTSRAARPATPSPPCSSSSRAIPRSTRSCTSGSASSRTRRACCAPAASIPTTASSGSSRTTSARTRGSRRPPPTSPTRPASRSSPRPSSRSPRPTTPGPATVRATGRLCYASANRAVDRAGTSMAVRTLPPNPRARVARRRAFAVAAVLAIVGAMCVALAVGADTEPAAAVAVSAVEAADRDAALVAAPRSGACSDPRSPPRSSDARSRTIAAPYSSCVAVDGAAGTARPDPRRRAPRRRVDAEAARRRGRARDPRPAPPLRRPAPSADATAARRNPRRRPHDRRRGRPDAVDVRRAEHARRHRTHRSSSAGRRDRRGRRAPHQRCARRRRQPLRPRPRRHRIGSTSELTEGDIGALGALIVNDGRDDNGLPASDPALDTVQDLATLLAARGVEIANGASDPAHAAPDVGARDRARRVAAARARSSRSCSTMSNNETAEMLTREIGVRTRARARPSAGTQAIPEVLAKLGVPVARRRAATTDPASRPRIASRARRCSAWSTSDRSRSSPRSTAASRSRRRPGTLIDRFQGTPLAGRLRAKTGHIDNVVGPRGRDRHRPARHDRPALASRSSPTATSRHRRRRRPAGSDRRRDQRVSRRTGCARPRPGAALSDKPSSSGAVAATLVASDRARPTRLARPT